MRVCESIKRENRSGFRKSLKGPSFRVESKVFEIKVEEKKGIMQAIIVERKKGIFFWVKLEPESLGFLLESLNQSNIEVKTGRWERDWKENGRSYSLVRDENKGGVLSSVRCCGSGEEELQHLHSER